MRSHHDLTVLGRCGNAVKTPVRCDGGVLITVHALGLDQPAICILEFDPTIIRTFGLAIHAILTHYLPYIDIRSLGLHQTTVYTFGHDHTTIRTLGLDHRIICALGLDRPTCRAPRACSSRLKNNPQMASTLDSHYAFPPKEMNISSRMSS